jgi:phage portal protein BeeE
MFDRLKSWLQPPERKASRSARLIAIESGGRARWTPRDYAALAREGYQCNAIVYRAVRLIAESIGALSFVLYEGSAELTAHPLLDLLARPNPRQDGASLLEAVSSHLLLAGNAYLEAVAIDREAKPNVRELYALRPDRMKVVPGPDGWPLAYEYTVAGQTVRFDQGAALPPILQLTLFNPLDDYYGLSPLEAAAVAVDTHNAAAKWNKALLDNAARPSGALVYAGPEGAVMSDAQFERLKKELSDQYQARPMPAARCCSKAGSTGRRCRYRPKTWTSWRPSIPPRARSRSPSGCRPCCWRLMPRLPADAGPRADRALHSGTRGARALRRQCAAVAGRCAGGC